MYTILRSIWVTLILVISTSLGAASKRSDFNGNGTSDLLWRNSTTGQVYVMPMLGGVVQAGSVVWTEPNPAWQIVGTGDFDSDGKSDILWWNSSTGRVFQMLMNGTMVKSSGLIYTEANTAWTIQAVADFDGDGKADILWRNSSTGQVYLMPMNGAAVQPGGVIWTEPSPAWHIVAAADFTGDSKADILWWNSSTGQVFLMRTNGLGAATGAMIYTEANTAWKIAGSGDFNGDGFADILWRNTTTGQIYEMPMLNGIPQTGGIVWTELSPLWQIVAIGDFNGDGKEDIVWRNSATGQIYQMLMDGLAIKAGAGIYSEPDPRWGMTEQTNQVPSLMFVLSGNVPLEVVSIPGGTFTMGSPITELARLSDEGPQHQVTLSPFYMAKFSTTQAQWVALLGSNPSYFTGDLNLPVEQVSWNDITQVNGFLDKLNAATAATRPAGLVFRLPTEAEREYAARGGTTTRFYWGDDPTFSEVGAFAWHSDDSGSTTHPVGQKFPNAYGLYDMSGNVWGWCQDWFGGYGSAAQLDPAGPATGLHRVLRGGGYSNDDLSLRSADRTNTSPTDRYPDLGFRVVLGAPRIP